MFLTQIPTTAGLDVAVIADLDVERARAEFPGADQADADRTSFLDAGRGRRGPASG